MKPVLNYTLISQNNQAERWLVILHGIYGAGRNWQSIARRLTEARPEWGGILVDLRLHGGSQQFAAPHTLATAAQDVAELLDQLGLPIAAIAGHSFGGKVVLRYLEQRPAGLEQVWIMDSTPQARPPDGDAWELLEVIRRLPENFLTRQIAVEKIIEAGYSSGLAQWMATNLVQVDGSWRWRLDFAGLEALLLDFFRADLWSVVENPPPGVKLHFVKAEKSAILGATEIARLEEAGRQNGQIQLHYLSGGHWLNVDNPQGVIELLSDWL